MGKRPNLLYLAQVFTFFRWIWQYSFFPRLQNRLRNVIVWLWCTSKSSGELLTKGPLINEVRGPVTHEAFTDMQHWLLPLAHSPLQGAVWTWPHQERGVLKRVGEGIWKWEWGFERPCLAPSSGNFSVCDLGASCLASWACFLVWNLRGRWSVTCPQEALWGPGKETPQRTQQHEGSKESRCWF